MIETHTHTQIERLIHGTRKRERTRKNERVDPKSLPDMEVNKQTGLESKQKCGDDSTAPNAEKRAGAGAEKDLGH